MYYTFDSNSNNFLLIKTEDIKEVVFSEVDANQENEKARQEFENSSQNWSSFELFCQMNNYNQWDTESSLKYLLSILKQNGEKINIIVDKKDIGKIENLNFENKFIKLCLQQ